MKPLLNYYNVFFLLSSSKTIFKKQSTHLKLTIFIDFSIGFFGKGSLSLKMMSDVVIKFKVFLLLISN